MDQRILFWIGLLPLILIVAIVALKGERLVKALPDSAAADSFKKNLWKRYFNTDYPTFPSGDGTSSESRQLSDRLITYLERVIDRTINKARGVLPFNSLIMAVMSIEKNRLNITFSFENAWPSWTIVYFYAVIFGLALSSYKCLELFLVRFSRSERYGKIEHEVDDTVDVLMSRGRILEWAVWLSEASLWSGIVVVVAAEALLAAGLLPPPK